MTIFKKWGKPAWIKIDNGAPFGDPFLVVIPLLSLWLIGLDIKVIRNRPATPQDNAKVERSQGVLGRWTDYTKLPDVLTLQTRLLEEANFHNCHFPIRRKGHKTRLQLFPTLAHTGRMWEPSDFQLSRILNFLAQGSWERKVSQKGQIYMYGQRFSVGTTYKHQIVEIRLNAEKNCWDIFDTQGKRFKQQASGFTTTRIWQLDFQDFKAQNGV